MMSILVWLLIATGNRGYYTVPDLPSRAACEQLYQALYRQSWVNGSLGTDHTCIEYSRVK